MTVAFPCGAGVPPAYKVSQLLRGSRADRGVCACAKPWLGKFAMVKNWRRRTLCTACSSKKTQDVSEVSSTFEQGSPVVFKLGENRFPTFSPPLQKAQSKSENPQQGAAVRKFHAYKRSEVPEIRKFSAYEIFWIYSIYYSASESKTHQSAAPRMIRHYNPTNAIDSHPYHFFLTVFQQLYWQYTMVEHTTKREQTTLLALSTNYPYHISAEVLYSRKVSSKATVRQFVRKLFRQTSVASLRKKLLTNL